MTLRMRRIFPLIWDKRKDGPAEGRNHTGRTARHCAPRGILRRPGRSVCLLLWAILLVTAAFSLGGCGDETKVVLTTGMKENEVFRIADASCTLPEAMIYLTNLQNQYEEVYGAQIWEVEGSRESLEDGIKQQVLGELAQVKSMVLLAEQKGIGLDETEEQRVQAAAAEYFDSLNGTERTLLGADSALIGQMYREYALAEKVYRQIVEDVNPEISDDEARTITVQMIRISEKGAAEEVRQQAEEGADFEALAQENSEDSVITSSFGKGEKEAALEKAAFNLGKDEISGVVAGEDGYYIIKCINTFDEAQTQLNKEKIADERRNEAFSREYDTFVDSLVRQLNEELWDPVTLIHDEAVTTTGFFDVYERYFEAH